MCDNPIGNTKKHYDNHFCDQSLCDTPAVAMLLSPKETDKVYGIKTTNLVFKTSRTATCNLCVSLCNHEKIKK